MSAVSTRFAPALFVLAVVVFLVLLMESWSEVPFWPDSVGYTSHIAEGRWVAHPPGYPAFVALGRLPGAIGIPPYLATQLASLALFLASLPVLLRLFTRFLGSGDAWIFAMAVLFCWVSLLVSRTGTSHAADFFTVSLLLLVFTSPSFLRGESRWFLLMSAALVLCAAFRLTTLIMMGPALLLAVAVHWRRRAFWAAIGLTAAATGLIQSFVVWQSGGWEAYTAYASGMAGSNRQASILLSGVNQATLFNVARSLFWFALAVAPLLPMALSGWRWPRGSSPDYLLPLLFALATSLGSLAATTLYLCTHPGYLVPALPGFWTAVAILACKNHKPSAATSGSKRLRFWSGAAVVYGLALFLSLKPILPPSSPREAVANGILLQYGRWAVKNSIFLTTSEWLIEAGSENLVPKHRVGELEAEKRRMETSPMNR